MKIGVAIKGLKSLDRTLKTESQRQAKALNIAIKVEGFRLMRKLKKQIRDGDPGGRKFAPLSYMARVAGRRLKPNKPLRRLAVAVRYNVRSQRPFEMEVGWVGKISKSWKRIAEYQQEGFERDVTKGRRRYFMHKAEDLSDRSVAKRYLYLKMSSRKLKTPERPILDPFWRAERRNALRNIQRNYEAKLRGQRI